MHRTKQEDSFVRNQDGTLGFYSNPITGCLNGCFYCYARSMANDDNWLRLKQRYLSNNNIAPPYGNFSAKGDPFYPRFWSKELQEIRKRKKPAGIFICDMGELFGDWIPRDWQDAVFETIRACPQHRFYLLTKQPQNLHLFSPYPDNCWVGVSATDGKMAQGALLYLREIKSSIKFVSFEPLLSKVILDCEGLDWGVIGAQSKPRLLPEPEWVSGLIRCLDQAGAKVFLKDSLGLEYIRREMP